MADQKPRRPDDSRAYDAKLHRELMAGGVAIIVVIGGGLIALIWGPPGLLTALPCFGGTVLLGGLLWLILKLLEYVGRDRD